MGDFLTLFMMPLDLNGLIQTLIFISCKLLIHALTMSKWTVMVLGQKFNLQIGGLRFLEGQQWPTHSKIFMQAILMDSQ